MSSVDDGSADGSQEIETPTTIQGDQNLTVVLAVDRLADALGRRIDALQRTIDRELRAEATREKVVDRLHAELQDYKNDLVLSLMRPIFLELIQLHDELGKSIAEKGPDPERIGIRQAIEDILYRQGVESFTTEDDDFDPRRQRALSTVPTDDPQPGKRIASRVRSGFRSGERILRPEIVIVYALPQGTA